MSKLWKISGILLAAVALICIGICILQEGQNKALLPVGLSCNALALLIYCLAIKKRK